MFCSNCGFNNPSGMRFCGNCGSPLDIPAQKPATQLKDHNLPQAIGAMTGTDLLERFHKAGLEAAGQRRNVTVLFVDLSGYTHLSEKLEDEVLYELIQQYIRLLTNDVYKFEGMVDKYTGDGLMALFGAPIAHENNAELAVRAALDMHADVEALSKNLKGQLGSELRVHIGLHTGLVIVGGIGTDFLMNYTAIGDTVNLAQRLEQAAPPGATLVSEAIFRQTRALFEFNPSPTLQLKGVSQPIKGYQVLGVLQKPGIVRGIEGLRAPMIGRDAEFSQLKQAVQSLVGHKKGQFVLLTGEAGIGKSRLTAEMKASLDLSAVQVIEGQSLTYRRLVAYWIFLDALRNCLGIVADSPPALVKERLTQVIQQNMDSRGEEILPYLEHVLSLDPSDKTSGDRIQYLDAIQLRQQIFLSLRDFFIAMARGQPLILILEDLHWADQASLDLLLFLLESIDHAPLLIVAISRPFQEGSLNRIEEWARQNLPRCYLPINLHSLSEDQSGQLLTQLLDTPELPETLRDSILQKSAGIPFYLEEILRMLIDEGMFQRVNNRWKIVPGTNTDALPVPETLEGLILARFDRLDAIQRRVLQVASVIGLQFSRPVLQMVLQSIDRNELEKILMELIQREFIIPQPDSPFTEYTFRHTLMSDAIYKTILKKERSELHGLIGEAIESIHFHRLEDHIEILARHYSWSSRKDRALHYLILAGEKAARNNSNDHARQHYEQALELIAEVPFTPLQAIQVHAGLGDVLVFTGEYTAAREQYQSALKIINEHEPIFSEKHSALIRKIGTTYERQGNYGQSLVCLADAQHVLDDRDSPDTVERAQIFNDTGWVHFRRGAIEAAEQNLIDARGLAEKTNRYDVIASIYNRLGGVYFQKEQLNLASYYVQKSLALREEIGDIAAVARSYNNLGLLAWKRGQLDKALENFMRSYDLHANLGDIEGIIDLHGNLGLLQLDRGDLESAEKHLEESLAKAKQIGHSFIIGTAQKYMGRLYLLTEDWGKSIEFSSLSLQTFQGIGAKDELADVYNNISQAWLGMNDLEQAEKWAEKALLLLKEKDHGEILPVTDDRGRALRLLGQIAYLHGIYPRAEKLLKESRNIFININDQLEEGRTIVSMARLQAARKDKPGSRVLFNEARVIFRQLGAQLDLKRLSQPVREY
ncbi:MAG: tetratricopeptide repeat protein [Omnitrophica WOR_2 bacterium]